MRTSSLLPAFTMALAGAGVLLPACGGTVTTGAGGTSGMGGAAVSTGGATGTGATTTGPIDAGGPPDASRPPEAGPPEAGSTCPGAGDACTNCLALSCSAAYCSCYGNVDCSQLFHCYQACAPNDMACAQTCETAHRDGISAALLLSGCAATQCPQACPGNTPLNACQQCLYSKCDVQMNTCVANAECVAYFGCIKPCNGDATCVAQCQAAHPAGLVDASKVNTCAAVSCPGLCG